MVYTKARVFLLRIRVPCAFSLFAIKTLAEQSGVSSEEYTHKKKIKKDAISWTICKTHLILQGDRAFSVHFCWIWGFRKLEYLKHLKDTWISS